MSMIEADSDATPILLSPSEIWNWVDPLGADLDADPSVAGLAALPYHLLLGPGFERLCYEVLVAEGHTPRFFGRSGQADHGVDIIDEVGTQRTVYQCKNLKEAPAWTDIRNEILQFESKWIGKADLPPPTGYVYCCPHPLDDRHFGEEWTRFKDAFRERTRVEISFRDQYFLDTRLRHLPDVVAGRFSDSYATHFCGYVGWTDDPWTRVCFGNARHASIKRFLERHHSGAIYVSEKEAEEFRALLISSSVLAVRGPSGAGKTLTSLEMICRLRDPLRRIYYATLKGAPDVERLWQSVRRRKSLPAVFVIDDCHLDMAQTQFVLERLAPELSDTRGTVRVLLITTDAPGPAFERFDDTPDWLVRLEQDGVVFDINTSLERTRNVVKHLRPEWAGLSAQRFQRLHYLSGGDLMLLDEVLAATVAPSDLETMRPDGLYASLRSRYFGGNRLLPSIKKLACLAQYDLVPLASFIDNDWLEGEKRLAAPIINEMFAPPRYQFLHSALAELVLRALQELEVASADIDEGVAEATKASLVAYLGHVLVSGHGGAAEFVASVTTFLRGRVNLTERNADAQIKCRVLADETVRIGLSHNPDLCSFGLLGTCVAILSTTAHPAKADYIDIVTRRFDLLFEGPREGYDEIGLKAVGTGVFILARDSPLTLQALEKKYDADTFLRLIVSNGTLFELFKILEHASPAFRAELLDQLNETIIRDLIDKTIAGRRSIGTLDFTMRGLGDSDPALLERLERAIGASRFVRLIVANGTLFELFRILQHASLAFRAELLDQLNETTIGDLIDKTIDARRSISTLDLTMRELGDSDPALLERLEQAIGASRFVRLIVANGTLFELFRTLQYGNPAFRAELLDQLNETTVSDLIDKTIAAGRSIGTFHLAMRKLGDSDPALLERLEQAIGARRFVWLIVANGTLFELFMILKYANPTFRAALLDQLDETTVNELIAKTVAAGRSIGTLDLAMRELGDSDPALLERLEQAIGARRFVRLIVANGTLSELFRIMQHANPAFRAALLDQLNETTVSDLIAKTIAARRSIETFHFTLYRLARINTQRNRLEELLGTQGWWRLCVGTGSLNALVQITDAMSDDFRTRFISSSSTLGEADWHQILLRGLFRNACAFAAESVRAYPEGSRAIFHVALGQTAHALAAKASWSDLNGSHPPDSGESLILREAMQTRIASITVDDMADPDFSEAANYLAFAWRERPDLRSALATRNWATMADPRSWPKDESAVGALRLILHIARSEIIPEHEAQRLQREIVSSLDRDACANTRTLPLFLLLWNLAAVRYERGENRSFDQMFPDAFIETLLEVLKERVQATGDNSEKVAQLALGGLLVFLVATLRKRILRILAPLAKSASWLKQEALERTFVPAFFALEGVALLTTSASVFTPQVCFGLLWKSGDYGDVGPAIEHLRKRLKR